MSGWIAISRDLFAHDFFAREPMSEREAWVWMIARAAWKDTRHRIGGEMVDVPRGSFFCTLRELQQAWGWGSDKRVRSFLKRLENERMVDASTDAKKTQITICNYEQFQDVGRNEDASAPENGRSRDAIKEQVNNKQEDISSYEEIVIRAVDDISEAVKVYNDAATRAAWPSVQKMTAQRRKALRARLSEFGGLDGWRCAIGKAEASDFLCGRTAKPWAGFGFDWLTKPANFTKLMEGNYDNRDCQGLQSGTPGVHSDPTLRAIFAAAGAFKA